MQQEPGLFLLGRQPTALQSQRWADIKAHPDWPQKQFAEAWGVSQGIVGRAIHLLYMRERYMHPRSHGLPFSEHYVHHKDDNFKQDCRFCDKRIVQEFWRANYAR